MPIFKKTIFTGFAPNLTGRDTLIALSYLLLPWQWLKINRGGKVRLAEEKISQYFKLRACYAFDSGRSALYFALKALDVKPGDEIILQAYTCMVVVNAVNWTGAKPVFADIDNDFNMSATDLEKKITGKTKVLIIQHTFGLAADIDKLLAIAKKHNLKVIEDCAHSFGTSYNGRLSGTFGDIGMLSFGADKVISSVRGGALLTNDAGLAKKIETYQSALPKPKLTKTLQHLMHLPIFYLGKKFYGFYAGKLLLAGAKKLNLINKVIYKEEKKGEPVSFYPAKFANALATILLKQLSDVDAVNSHRKKIAEFYDSNISNPLIELPWAKEKISDGNSIYLRYPILVDNPKKLLAYAKARRIILGNWYDAVIAPADIDSSKTGYVAGSCPNAERLAARSVNLPTNRHIDAKAAERVVELINNYK